MLFMLQSYKSTRNSMNTQSCYRCGNSFPSQYSTYNLCSICYNAEQAEKRQNDMLAQQEHRQLWNEPATIRSVNSGNSYSPGLSGMPLWANWLGSSALLGIVSVIFDIPLLGQMALAIFMAPFSLFLCVFFLCIGEIDKANEIFRLWLSIF